MQWVELKVGDTAWVHNGKGELHDGRVVHILKMHDRPRDHYIIEFQTSIEPVLSVYDGFTVSDAQNKPIGMWRKNVVKNA